MLISVRSSRHSANAAWISIAAVTAWTSINSAKIATVGVEGMGYAISINTAMPIIQQLVNKGYVTRPYLGVNLYTVDRLAIIQYKLKVDTGVLITQVLPGGPAAQAGLQAGDVIVSVDGQEVITVGDLTKILSNATISEPLSIDFWRGNTESTVEVVPIASPPPRT